jgi:hypothetical protein
MVKRVARCSEDKIQVSVDCEWNIGNGTSYKTRTVQLSFPPLCVEQTVVLRLTSMDADKPSKSNKFPKHVRDLLQLPNIVARGVNMGQNIQCLGNLGVSICERRDHRYMGEELDFESNHLMKALYARYLGIAANKSGQNDDYSVLTTASATYCALNALLSRKLCEKMLSILALLPRERVLGEPENIQVGSQVELVLSQRVCAVGEVVFVGRHGAQQKLGGVTLGKKRALLKLQQIGLPGQRPPFAFKPSNVETQEGKVEYHRGSTTLNWIFDHVDNPTRPL